jgi:hypothetical protein
MKNKVDNKISIGEIRERIKLDTDEFQSFIEDYSKGSIQTFGGIDVKIVDSFRCDAEYSVIFEIFNRLFKVDGTYDSWSGTSWYDCAGNFYEVEEKKVVVTRYLPV